MKSVVILVPEQGVMAAVVDARDMLMTVNDLLVMQGRDPLFEVTLVGLSRETTFNDGLFTIHNNARMDEVQAVDLIIIPAIRGDINLAIERNRSFFNWVVDRYHGGAEVASLCLGAFLLAATGLLDGKVCSTHWLYASTFQSMFPRVTLEGERVVTDHSRLYSSGGASNYWNLLLHLVEKYTDREIALTVSKFFMLDFNRGSQAPFAVFKGQKMHGDAEILRIQEYIEKNFNSRETVAQLCLNFGIGRRTLERRFKKATNNTITEYIIRVRIEASKKRLEASNKTLTEILFEIGYRDNKTFRHIFQKVTGLSPREYRKKFNRTFRDH